MFIAVVQLHAVVQFYKRPNRHLKGGHGSFLKCQSSLWCANRKTTTDHHYPQMWKFGVSRPTRGPRPCQLTVRFYVRLKRGAVPLNCHITVSSLRSCVSQLSHSAQVKWPLTSGSSHTSLFNQTCKTGNRCHCFCCMTFLTPLLWITHLHVLHTACSTGDG